MIKIIFALDFKRYWGHFGWRTRFLSLVSVLAVIALLSVTILSAINLSRPDLTVTPSNVANLLTPTIPPFGLRDTTASGPTANSIVLSPTALANPPANPLADATQLLAQADNYANQGRYDLATTQYRQLLQKYPQNQYAPAASYGLAKATQQQGQLAAATQLFKLFVSQYNADPRKPLAYLALGDLASQQGKWSDALDFYQKYQGQNNLLEGYVDYKIAHVYDSILQTAQAMSFYQKTANSQTTVLERVQAMEKLGDYYAKTTNIQAAIDWYNQILGLAKMPEYRANIMAKIAGVYSNANQPSQADTIYNQLVEQYLDTTAGQRAFSHLNTNNPNLLDWYERGYIHWLNEEYSQAVKDFNQYLGRSDPNSAVPNPPNQNQEVQNRRAWAWFWLARSYELGGDLPKGITEYRALQSRYPQAAMSPEALWRSAATLEKAGAIQDAINEYAKVAATYSNSDYASQALTDQARLLQQQYGPDAAKPVLTTLATKYPASPARDQVLYNMARTYGAQGNMGAARNALTQAAHGVSGDYYAMRAQELLDNSTTGIPARSNQQTHPAVYDATRFQADISRDRSQMETWLSHWAVVAPSNGSASTATQQLNMAHNQISNDTALLRIDALQQVGWTSEAGSEAKELNDKYASKPLELYFLAVELNQRGQYYYSILAAKQLLSLAQAQNLAIGIQDVPLLLQKLIYPLDYQDSVLEQAQRQNIDPLLLLALIKQESAFQPNADSGADARGLTQVIPSTGAAIAANLGINSFSPDDLFRPYTSIQFGAYYLANRLRDYNNEPCEALAAYNGGEGNVNKWAAAHPPSSNLDDFVENITYSETRNYVKVVYANYAMYRYIYAAKNTP